jgi:putative addiction module component (TIGR02574 family)
MPIPAEELFREALRLSEQERGELAAKLIESLDPDMEGDVEACWSSEIRKRLEELDSGRVQPVPWPEALPLILEDGDEPPTG